MKRFHSVEEYLSAQPEAARQKLEVLREAIRKAAPKAQEVLHYNMPAFRQESILVWYAGFKGHVGFYPRASAITAFKSKLAGYEISKGAIRFPLGKAIPVGLVKKIVRFRITEDEGGLCR